MTRSVLIEGIILIVVSLVAVGEGLRLVIYKDPYTLYDPLGPGLYALIVGLGLMAVAIAYVVVHRGKPSEQEVAPADRSLRVQLGGTLLACIVYVSLIDVVGYLPATICFFLMELRIERIRSWPLIIALSLALSGLYYLVFVHYCGIVFPRGIFR